MAVTTALSPGCAISPARKSRNPSSSSASRRSAGVSSAGSASSAGSIARTSSWSWFAEALDAAEHAHGVALGEPAVEEIDVVPHAALDAAAGIDELEREVVGAAARAQPPLSRDRVGALDDRVLGKLGYRRHARRV